MASREYPVPGQEAFHGDTAVLPRYVANVKRVRNEDGLGWIGEANLENGKRLTGWARRSMRDEIDYRGRMGGGGGEASFPRKEKGTSKDLFHKDPRRSYPLSSRIGGGL